MRRVKAKIKKFVRNAIVVAAIFIVLFIVNYMPTIPTNTFHWVGGGIIVGLFIWLAFKIFHKPERYINERGYVVLVRENELEHRFIAKQLLKRDLYPNEVVHHINGNKTDNLVRNLCLMDNEKHEHFHSWLSWKKSKNGSYPRFREQKRVLVDEYGGTLLESIRNNDNLSENKPTYPELPTHLNGSSGFSVAHELNTSEKLFEELRSLRRKLASERKVPAYMVFDDKTLAEMAESLPDTEELLLQIKGVGPTKLQMYGPQFISVLKKFKVENKLTSKSKIDSA